MCGWRQPDKEEDLSHPGLSENRNIIRGREELLVLSLL